nr:DUF3373 domain-containing protein [Hydrogenivirga caldilitoris]
MKRASLYSLLLAGSIFAQPSDELKQLREEVEVLKEELRKLRLEISIPQITTYQSYSGLGPAASKALINPKGVSVGGYGEVHFYKSNKDIRGGTKSYTDLTRLILYIGYAFTEKLKFTSELELEHASTNSGHGTGGGYFKAELAILDYNFKPQFGVRGGLLLIPVGIINEVHEPPTFYTVDRPYLERNIIPTTWEEIGVGAYGTIGMVDYRVYVTNALMLKGGGGYSPSAPLKTARQRGARAVSERFGLTGRVDLNLPYNLKLGGSFWTGDVQSKGGSDSNLGLRRGEKVGSVTLFSPHLWWQWAGFDVRVVGAYVKVNDADKIGNDLGVTNYPSKMQGFYTQVAYNVLRLTDIEQELYIFGMYENYDTHASVPSGYSKPAGHKVQIFNVGLSYKPHPLVALKADYVKEDYSDGNDDRNLYRAAISWMF